MEELYQLIKEKMIGRVVNGKLTNVITEEELERIYDQISSRDK